MSYLGSKGQSGVWQRIIGNMPPHDIYVECCLGSGQVLRRKMPSGRDVGIDVNADVIAKFRFDYPTGAEIVAGDFYAFTADMDLRGLIADGFRVLLYIDPPYHPETRTMRCGYGAHDWSVADHNAFLLWLQHLPEGVSVMVSGYPHVSYSEALSEARGWRCIEYTTRHHHKTVREALWLNFPEDVPHFHTLAGSDRRERWRIKKKAERHYENMIKMPLPERQAVFAAGCRAMNYTSPSPCGVSREAGDGDAAMIATRGE